MSPSRPNVFTIPSGTPFLPVLAEAFLAGRLGAVDRRDPLALAGATILLPTRRAVRVFRDLLVERLGGEAAILPRIRPIGDIDEEDHLLDPGFGEGAELLALPPAIPLLARRLALTRLILAWGRQLRANLTASEARVIPASAADTTRLAADLSRLIDDLATAGIGWDAVAKIVPDEQAAYFQMTLEFLAIAAERWPEFLADNGVVDPAARRDQLIRAEAGRLAKASPAGPIIAAGSTGSIPATRALLAAIAGRPDGAVVLPGLDQDLDATAWQAVGDATDGAAAAWSHPQFALKQLLAALGVTRDDVVPLAAASDALRRRARLVSEALRPAETTETWARFGASEAASATAEALAGVSVLVAQNEQEEGLAIAVAVRKALEEGVDDIALVTPDRAIARRVAVELNRWKLAVDDSAGAPLDRLPPGVFARLFAEAATSDADPVDLLALLKHPFAAFGMSRFDCRRAARMLELALFRGRRVPDGLAALPGALASGRAAIEAGARHVPIARRRWQPSDWNAAERLLGRLIEALAPLDAACRADVDAATAAGLLLDGLARASRDETGSDALLWQGAAGEALDALLGGLAETGASLSFAPAELPAFLDALLADVAVPRPPGADPRIRIWGALEARLQSAGLLILAGLDEGVWPGDTRTDPFLSRGMRAAIGLAPPERRTGQAAHDFVESFTAPRVIVTRAEKRGGTPTVASRWLQRLEALIGTDAAKAIEERGREYVELARDLDAVPPPRPVKRPKPMPPVAVRPRSLSITEIETFIRDPYETYAKHVLRLEELDPAGRPPDYSLRGTLIHDALARFSQEWLGPVNAAAMPRLREIGREVLAEIAGFSDVHAVWSLRFDAIARWLIGWEEERAGRIAERHAEIDGALELPAPAGPFRLRGRADRIDIRRDGSLEIIDFKTGTPPTAKQVLAGLNPQLGLEAGMARAGAFAGIPAGRSVARLDWIGLSRVDRDDPVRSAVERGHTADQIGEKSLALLRDLVVAFDDPLRAYVSRARPMYETRYESPYDHLARVREWGLIESEEEKF